MQRFYLFVIQKDVLPRPFPRNQWSCDQGCRTIKRCNKEKWNDPWFFCHIVADAWKMDRSSARDYGFIKEKNALHYVFRVSSDIYIYKLKIYFLFCNRWYTIDRTQRRTFRWQRAKEAKPDDKKLVKKDIIKAF